MVQFSRIVQAKDNFKVRDAFENLVRKIISKKPDAGRNEGSGNVFGAGVVVRYSTSCIPSYVYGIIIVSIVSRSLYRKPVIIRENKHLIQK